MYYYNNRYNHNMPTNRHPFPGNFSRGGHAFYDYPPQNHYIDSPPQPQVQQQHPRERSNSVKSANFVQNYKERGSANPIHDDYKNYICPGCNYHFDCMSRNNRYTGKVPLILNCQHTLCQECIYKGAVADNIMCPTCKRSSELTKKHLIDNLQDAFTPNYYLFGIIMWAKPQGSGFKAMTLVPTQVTLNNRKLNSGEQAAAHVPPEPGEKCCFVSCINVAALRCQDCNDVYCVDCCTVIHKSAKSLWSHVQVPITNSKFSAELERCPFHSNMDVEFFCNTCEAGACCYCFLEKHEGHERDCLSKLSDVELSEFRTYRSKAEQILKYLLISQKKLKNLYSSGTSAVESKICSYFVDLHAKFYVIEKNLQKQLGSLDGVGKTEDGLESIGPTLNKSIDVLKYLLLAGDDMNEKKINLKGLLQKLRDVQDTPCYLLMEDGNSADPIELEVNPLLQNAEELFKIRKLENCKYTLVNADQLPPNYVSDPAEESDAESCISSLLHPSGKEEEVQSRKTSTPSNSSANTKSAGHGRRKKLNGKQFISNHLQIPADNEMVEVTHIESLECFYVQLKKLQTRFIQMNKDVENYIKMGAAKVEHPQIGELYLAMYVTKSEKKWCRGRVTDIKGTAGSKQLYEVFFIDYGSTQMLTIDKLRAITANLSQKKPFAIQCELYNPTYANWGKNAHVYMGKMINGKELFMMVKNITNGVYQVDLMVSSSDRGLTSIIDILIHTCSNALSTSSDSSSVASQKRDTFIPESKIFSNSIKFRKNQIETVVLANVIDPHNIFVHIAAYVDALRKMCGHMKHQYKTAAYESCIPIEGTYVAVEYKDPIRGHWHRGLVKKVDMNTAKAHVLLVDWGNSVVVSWTNIRVLNEMHTRLESQAILVKLAHVEPYEGQQAWSEKATYFLQKNFRTQDSLKMIVQTVDPLEVALFETLGSVDICINAQLVQEKHADSTGKISQTVEWPQDEQEPPGFMEDEGFVATLLKKIDESDVDSEEEAAEVASLVKQQIEIVKVVSPDLIYIKFHHLEEQELTLHKELQICYQKERTNKDSWAEREDCVVIYAESYVRGKILEKVDNKYKINVYDKATEITLPKEKIFVYSDYFRKYPNIVYKSHLANIRPAGGDTWSLTSIEALEKVFDKYKDIYATKVQGDTSKKSIPMLIWYTQVKVGGALEPSIVKFVLINNRLVKMGFAYKQPTKNDEICEGEKTEIVEKTNLKAANELLISAIVHASSDKSNQSMDSASSEAEVNKSLENIEEESVPSADEVKDKHSLNSSHQTNTSTSVDWNELIEDEEKESLSNQSSPYHTREAEITDWKPAFPIKKLEFNAWITCAETEGILYLRDEDLQTVYKDMEANLKQYFDGLPPLNQKSDWHPGQICTIAYKDYWYRGKILKLNSPNEIVAIMIDFGSDHVLSPKQLYREILYPEIPAFASRIKLDRVYAKSGSWLSSDYETLLDVVTEYAKVVIKGPLDDEVPSAEVFTKNGQSINQLLASMCPNLTRCLSVESDKGDDDSIIIEKEEPLRDSLLSLDKDLEAHLEQVDTTDMEFKVEPLPESAFKEKTLMSIVAVLSYNKVVLKQPNDTLDELYLLSEKIQDCYATQPVLEDVKIGMPCICPYAEDGVWYRARIHNIDGLDCGYVFVFYVDFGNVESVAIKDVKMMRPDWFDLPVSSYIADVNIELKTDNHLEHVFQHIKKLFGKNKLVEFISEDPLTVNLYEDNGELCYQSLVNGGLLTVKV